MMNENLVSINDHLALIVPSLLFLVSFDARGSTIENGKHWSDEHLLGRRAYFRLHNEHSRGGASSPGAHLELFPVQDRDEAIYRCRVDFLLSPTKNTIANFTVISEYPQVFSCMIMVLLFYVLSDLFHHYCHYCHFTRDTRRSFQE